MKHRATTIVPGGGLVAVPAVAADLAETASAAANRVRVRDAGGAGDFSVPGSEARRKIGGFARAQHAARSTDASAGVGRAPVTGPTVVVDVEYRDVDFASSADRHRNGVSGARRIERPS